MGVFLQKYGFQIGITAVTFFWYHDIASLSFEAICVSSQRVRFHWKRRKCVSKSSCWRLLSRFGYGLKAVSLSLSMSCSFSGCLPGRKRRGGGGGNGRRGDREASAPSGASVDAGTASTRAGPPRPPPSRSRLTWCPLPGRLPAGPPLLSDPGRAGRPGARRRARQAASSPRGPDTGGAVTMETAAASPARGSGQPSALRRAACSHRRPT